MKIALQMDPIESINTATDSSFLLGLGAQELGHELWYYTPRDLHWSNGSGRGTLCAKASPLTFRREQGNHFTLGTPRTVALADDMDIILLRQDPPFHMGYLTTTYLLEQVADKVRVLNDPKGVRDAPEKMLITHLAHFMPPTLISGDADEIKTFAARHKNVVAKRLYGFGGHDVFQFAHDDPALLSFAADQWQKTGEPVMLQAFLPEVEQGDKRIILFGGEPVGAIQRIPARGEFRANLAQGGSAARADITPHERDICAALAPLLRAKGLYFAGIDLIGGRLIEINVTSPTGLAAVNRVHALTGDDRMEILFWKKLL